MDEFLGKFENRGIKIARVLNSHHQIYQFTLILYGIEVRCDVDIFKLTAHAQSINRESRPKHFKQYCDVHCGLKVIKNFSLF